MLALRDLKLSKAEKLWLTAIYENNRIPDPQTFKVKLFGQIPPDFPYQNLHRTFLWDNRLNVLGVWLLNPKDKIFESLDRVIKAIRVEILKNPKIKTISSKDVSKLAQVTIEDTNSAIWELVNHHGFLAGGGANGDENGNILISFNNDEHIDTYLNYKDIPTFLEKTWTKYRLDNYIRPEEANSSTDEAITQLCYTKLCHTITFGKKNWAFHDNGSNVIRILIETYRNELPEIHIKEIHKNLPKSIQSDSLSQIFKSHKGVSWKELVIKGPSGNGFWRLNPKYLEGGVKEIDLGISSENA